MNSLGPNVSNSVSWMDTTVSTFDASGNDVATTEVNMKLNHHQKIHHIDEVDALTNISVNITGHEIASTVADILRKQLGSEMFSVLIGFICVLMVFTVVGNALSLLVMQRKRFKAMPISTHMSALAVFDTVAFAVRAIVNFTDYAEKSNIMCKVFQSLRIFTAGASSWLIICVTFDRFIAVCFPLKSKQWCTKYRSYVAVVSVSIPIAVFSAHGLFLRESMNGACKVVQEYLGVQKVLWFLSLAIITWIPTVVLIGLNGAIAITLAVQTTNKKLGKRGTPSDSRKALKMVVTVSILYLVLTFPVALYYIFVILAPRRVKLSSFSNNVVPILVHILPLINHSTNFLCYLVSGKRFRTELGKLCKR